MNDFLVLNLFFKMFLMVKFQASGFCWHILYNFCSTSNLNIQDTVWNVVERLSQFIHSPIKI